MDFPVGYDEVRFTRTSLYAGVSLSVPVVDKLRWVSGIEISQKVGGHNPEFRGGARYTGGVAVRGDMRNTEGSVSSGLEYSFDDSHDVRLAVMPGVIRPTMGETDWGGVVSLKGRF